MVIRKYLKCDVCQAITVLRIQVGYLEQHPIRVHCGNCSILMEGTATLRCDVPDLLVQFQNATLVDEAPPQFYIEASGDLLTEKLQRISGSLPAAFSPFLEAMQDTEPEKFRAIMGGGIQFLHYIKNDWARVHRINELWLEGKEELAAREAGAYLPKKQFPMNNTLELYRAVHTANLLFLKPLLEHLRFWETADFLREEIKSIAESNREGLVELVTHFAKDGTLLEFERKLLRILSQFVEKFKFLLPALGLAAYKGSIEGIVRRKGITTASFEDLKQFYLDSYEIAGELVTLAVAFNNMKHRGDFRKMKVKRKDVMALADYEGKSKGERIQFIDGDETFDQLLVARLDNELRNAIGHNSYQYDGKTQVISYYPSGRMAQDDKKTIYLVEFARHCWYLFLSLIELGELVYQVARIDRLLKGDKPVDPRVFRKTRKKRKIARKKRSTGR